MSCTITQPMRKPRKRHVLTTIPATVTGSWWVTPRMVRIRIQSEEMARFLRPQDPDQFLTAIFPRPGQALIELGPDFNWEYFYQLPERVRPVARNYTVRSFDLDAMSVDIDVLVHDGSGAGEYWAANAQAGNQLYIWGPRIAYNPFPNAEFTLLFCDECGVPAAAAIIESLDIAARGHLVAEVKNPEAIPPMPSHPGIETDWLFSGDAEPGESGRLLKRIAELPKPEALVYAWGGGEMTVMREIARHLRKEWGLSTAAISATGYWRLGMSASD